MAVSVYDAIAYTPYLNYLNLMAVRLKPLLQRSNEFTRISWFL